MVRVFQRAAAHLFPLTAVVLPQPAFVDDTTVPATRLADFLIDEGLLQDGARRLREIDGEVGAANACGH